MFLLYHKAISCLRVKLHFFNFVHKCLSSAANRINKVQKRQMPRSFDSLTAAATAQNPKKCKNPRFFCSEKPWILHILTYYCNLHFFTCLFCVLISTITGCQRLLFTLRQISTRSILYTGIAGVTACQPPPRSVRCTLKSFLQIHPQPSWFASTQVWQRQCNQRLI